MVIGGLSRPDNPKAGLSSHNCQACVGDDLLATAEQEARWAGATEVLWSECGAALGISPSAVSKAGDLAAPLGALPAGLRRATGDNS